MSFQSAVRIGRIRLRSGAEIRVLPGGSGGHADVNEVLQRFLGESRAGRLSAVAIVAVQPDGTVLTGWKGADRGHHHHLASGALTLARRISEG